jgi:hypothetical protein
MASAAARALKIESMTALCAKVIRESHALQLGATTLYHAGRRS